MDDQDARPALVGRVIPGQEAGEACIAIVIGHGLRVHDRSLCSWGRGAEKRRSAGRSPRLNDRQSTIASSAWFQAETIVQMIGKPRHDLRVGCLSFVVPMISLRDAQDAAGA